MKKKRNVNNFLTYHNYLYNLDGTKAEFIEENIDSEEIAKMLDGGSCAVLETVINEAAILAGYEGKEKIHYETPRAKDVEHEMNDLIQYINQDDENIPVLTEDELTEGEKDNLDAAIDDVDWEAIFNDSYGPTLKP